MIAHMYSSFYPCDSIMFIKALFSKDDFQHNFKLVTWLYFFVIVSTTFPQKQQQSFLPELCIISYLQHLTTDVDTSLWHEHVTSMV